MGLKDIKIPQRKIEVGEGVDFTVRGLSLADVGILAQRHHIALSALFSEIAGVAASKDAQDMQDTVAARLPELMADAPKLVCDLIALAEGDIGSSDAVGVLPIPVQIEALSAVFELTFRTEADLKNVVQTVIRGLQATTRQLSGLNLN